MKKNKIFKNLTIPLVSALFSLAVVAFDLISKYIVASKLAVGESKTVIPYLLEFMHIKNKGAAYGSFSQSRVFLVIITLVGLLILFGVQSYFIYKKNKVMAAFILPMLTGGALGNAFERIFLADGVTDFIVFPFIQGKLAFNCNIADIFISVGFVSLVVYLLVFTIKKAKTSPNKNYNKLSTGQNKDLGYLLTGSVGENPTLLAKIKKTNQAAEELLKDFDPKGKHTIFIDLDGTLLEKRSDYSEFTKKTLKNVEKNEHTVILASGRPKVGVDYIYKNLGLKSKYIIADNGATLIDMHTGKTVFKNYIKPDLFLSLVDTNSNIIESYLFNIDNLCYVHNYDDRLARFSFFAGQSKVEIIEITKENRMSLPDFPGALVLLKPEKSQEFEEIISKKFSGLGFRYYFDVYTENGNFPLYEVHIKGQSKAISIFELAKLKEVDLEQAIAFGDNINDVEMLDSVKYGVAMRNSREVLYPHAKLFTNHTNKEDGVAKCLAEVFKLTLK